jgi:hypothetical protein
VIAQYYMAVYRIGVDTIYIERTRVR